MAWPIRYKILFFYVAALSWHLYTFRSFRSVGDEIFIQSFEEATLPFENWTHEAHLRMAWTYIREHGREKSEPYIKYDLFEPFSFLYL